MGTASRLSGEELTRRFVLEGVIKEVTPITQGHINETWLSRVDVGSKVVGYIHQRINPAVFSNGALVMENIRKVTEHLRGRSSYPYQVLHLVPTVEGKWWWCDDDGAVWRTYHFIEGAVAYDQCPNEAIARAAGRSFGSFLRELAGLPVSSVSAPIPGFQDVAGRFGALRAAYEMADSARRAAGAAAYAFAGEQEDTVRKLGAVMSDPSHLRITHGDTKLNNVLFDRQTGQALCVIDLDTVMPGSPLYDFGDFARQIGVQWPEDGAAESDIPVRCDLLQVATEGFLAGVGPEYLSDRETASLGEMPALLSLTLGVRFLTDYFAGDPYFRIAYPEHNLVRARCQFAIAQAYVREQRRLSEAIDVVIREAREGNEVASS